MCIKNAILKYGKENFSIRVLEECDASDLNEKEIYWISKYNSYKNGYNSTLGGSLSKFGTSKIDIKYHELICDSYISGASLRSISSQYEVDKHTIKNVLKLNNIDIRQKRMYKYTRETLVEIKDMLDAGISGKEICEKYSISKAYISQIKNGSRKI